MKKFLSAMVAVVAAVVLAVVAAACGATQVEGKTYVPGKGSYTLPEELKENEAIVNYFDAMVKEPTAAEKESGKIVFEAENKVTMHGNTAYYVQDGATVTIKESETATVAYFTFKVSGKKLTASADGSEFVNDPTLGAIISLVPGATELFKEISVTSVYVQA